MKRLMNIRHSFDLEVGDVGVTIRKGEKWSKVAVGTELELWNCVKGHKESCGEVGCKCEGKGKIVGSWVGELGKLPSSLLAIEHNKTAQNKETLKAMLLVGYGQVSDYDIITALIYERTVKE